MNDMPGTLFIGDEIRILVSSGTILISIFGMVWTKKLQLFFFSVKIAIDEDGITGEVNY